MLKSWTSANEKIRRAIGRVVSLLFAANVQVVRPEDVPSEANVVFVVGPINSVLVLELLRRGITVHAVSCVHVVAATAFPDGRARVPVQDLTRKHAATVLHHHKNNPPRSGTELSKIVDGMIRPLAEVGLLSEGDLDVEYLTDRAKKFPWSEPDQRNVVECLESLWRQLRS